ncbi:DNA methyltransferase [Denitrobacterium detoxificans]|uniref:DNA methyltransferase n=1 Tax=Denitrobacterium detoxificans TaxID=79604 RepID=UPI0026ECAD0C|nr:DNA methyltransferase [Denitrobacterium detoxificans]MBE6465894.1 class I SAM-dependent DNA methyltransferase [Denitrobacterium detoxificans]
MTPTERKKAATQFVERWLAAEGNEQREANSFWIELCQEVLGISNATHVLDFERKVKGRRIDVFYEDRSILIENKSRGVSLDEPEQRGKDRRGNPRMVTPFEQAKWYADNITPRSVMPQWILTCNFDEIRIYDLDDENAETNYEAIALEDLPNQLHRFEFFTKLENSRLEREKELSVAAGEVVGRLYDAFSKAYLDIENDKREQRSLNMLITRIVFLLYAEDADLLHERNAFYKYLKNFQVNHMRQALIDLFGVLKTPKEERDPYLDPDLAAFPYVNGGLFAEDIIIPQFNEDTRFLLLQEASAEFDWRNISPTIFGAVFESTLNPETRRSGGMHYTSIENIHKLIGPLFLDDLKEELTRIEGSATEKERKFKLKAFRQKLASLKILDPACGSGNFLTESYLSLRKLENRVLEGLYGDQLALGGDLDPIQVSIRQFYGIEINDFAVEVAKTALWIADLQMLDQTRDILGVWIDPLPLKSNDNIACGNALRIDWNDVLPAEECDYIVGNPPFYGARMQSKEQKADIQAVFHGAKNCGNVDYVAGWYMKASEFVEEYSIRCAFVSTNSICQGEQVANVWKPIYDMGVRIDFAYNTFRWRNEAAGQAHVFVVIVGFSKLGGEKTLFSHEGPDAEAVVSHPENINAYLSSAPDVFVWNRSKPLCDVPKIGIGSQPIDGGNYLFKEEEMQEFLSKEPAASKYFHRWLGSAEFLNGKPRYTLWLGEATQRDLIDLPLCRERIEKVRVFRESSNRVQTKKAASVPQHYGTEIIANGTSILIPKVSSERRRYVPLGFIGPETFCSDLVFLAPDATLYHFGVLHSQFHNAWMRVVAGRLESRYRYSGGVVYNNFVWPRPDESQLAAIERCAQSVLDVRALYPDVALAKLYDPDKMPDDLREAHLALDRAVEAAYGVDFNGDEEKIVAHLFKLYAEKTKGD